MQYSKHRLNFCFLFLTLQNFSRGEETVSCSTLQRRTSLQDWRPFGLTDLACAGNELTFHPEPGVDHVDAIAFRERDVTVVRSPGRIFALECILARNSVFLHDPGFAVGAELRDAEFILAANLRAIREPVVRGPGRCHAFAPDEPGDHNGFSPCERIDHAEDRAAVFRVRDEAKFLPIRAPARARFEGFAVGELRELVVPGFERAKVKVHLILAFQDHRERLSVGRQRPDAIDTAILGESSGAEFKIVLNEVDRIALVEAVDDAFAVGSPHRVDAERVVLRERLDIRAVEIADVYLAVLRACLGGKHDFRAADTLDAEELVQDRIDRSVSCGIDILAAPDGDRMNRHTRAVRDRDREILQVSLGRNLIGRRARFEHGEPAAILEVGEHLRG